MEKKNEIDLNCSAFADKDAVCKIVETYSSTESYRGIKDQITEKIMERATPSAWKTYDAKQRDQIISAIAEEIRGLK